MLVFHSALVCSGICSILTLQAVIWPLISPAGRMTWILASDWSINHQTACAAVTTTRIRGSVWPLSGRRLLIGRLLAWSPLIGWPLIGLWLASFCQSSRIRGQKVRTSERLQEISSDLDLRSISMYLSTMKSCLLMIVIEELRTYKLETLR